MPFERLGERRRIFVPIIQGDLDDRRRCIEAERSRGSFEPNALNEIQRSFSRNSLEDPMEVKRREARDARNILKLERAIEIGLDMGDRSRDPCFVLCS